MLAVAVAALALLAPAGPPTAANPCEAARAPLPRVAGISAPARAAIEAYRQAWRRACDPAAPAVDLGGLLGDAEALADDVATAPALEAIRAALSPVATWPLPGIRRNGVEPPKVDWGAFAAAADRGTAEDARFWRGAALAAGPEGEPAWLGERADGGNARCLKLAETRWRDVADALDAMERGPAAAYVRRARALRESLAGTFAGIARGGRLCACLAGQGAAALEPLAADAAAEQRLGTPGRRALAKAAEQVLAAIRAGRVRVVALRSAPGAPPVGCAP